MTALCQQDIIIVVIFEGCKVEMLCFRVPKNNP